MTDDPLDKTVSIGAEITPSGLNLNAKSRFVAAFDRLWGNAVDMVNVPMERRLTKDRTEIEGQKQLIEAITKAAVDRIGKDPEFAERAIRNHLGISVQRQENKDAVLQHAIEDLSRNPNAADAGPELDAGFINKFERQAEDAGTEELRHKWGRVLGAEIRKPGTVTPRVMRIVDEIDPETARMFEDFCRWRLGDAVPTCLSGELNDFRTRTKLVGSGLVVDPGFTGHVRQFSKGADNSGRELWFSGLGPRGLGFLTSANLGAANPGETTSPVRMHGEKPVIPVTVITEEGRALASILEDVQQQAFDAYVAKVREALPELDLIVYRRVSSSGDDWFPLYDLPAGVR
jgi:hypothetical protein